LEFLLESAFLCIIGGYWPANGVGSCGYSALFSFAVIIPVDHVAGLFYCVILESLPVSFPQPLLQYEPG
jgi:hypothetical protein